MRTRPRSRMSPLVALSLAACAGLALASCRSKPDLEAEPVAHSAVWPRDALVPVEIENHHTLDLVILVSRSGKEQRVGMATAARTTFLRLPVRLLGPGNELRLVAHALGAGRRLTSDRMTVMPGQQVVWTIESGFRHASAAVWE